MKFWNHEVKEDKDIRPYTPARRWLQTVAGYYPLYISMTGMLALSVLPDFIAVYAFYRSGGLIYLAAAFLVLPLYCPVWTACHRLLWELQYDHPVYCFKRFFSVVFDRFGKKYVLGFAMELLWLLILAPLIFSELTGTVPQIWLLVMSGTLILLLIPFAAYTHYQVIRWELSLPVILKNSFVLIFMLGKRSALVSLLWAVYAVVFLLFPPYLIAATVILAVPMLLTLSGHAIFSKAIDSAMS